MALSKLTLHGRSLGAGSAINTLIREAAQSLQTSMLLARSCQCGGQQSAAVPPSFRWKTAVMRCISRVVQECMLAKLARRGQGSGVDPYRANRQASQYSTATCMRLKKRMQRLLHDGRHAPRSSSWQPVGLFGKPLKRRVLCSVLPTYLVRCICCPPCSPTFRSLVDIRSGLRP